jgi:hypothetical protein
VSAGAGSRGQFQFPGPGCGHIDFWRTGYKRPSTISDIDVQHVCMYMYVQYIHTWRLLTATPPHHCCGAGCTPHITLQFYHRPHGCREISDEHGPLDGRIRLKNVDTWSTVIQVCWSFCNHGVLSIAAEWKGFLSLSGVGGHGWFTQSHGTRDGRVS